uniref:exocyst complex component 3-like protein 2 n=1 Tax=Agelaius phoeniceus TaxID=39638 RepID=UPI0023EB8244|nr:exocyst complex component 3-like protein 2 [Agelaius phoeniceus]
MGKSESLYALLAERMWTVVGEALSGSDRMLLEPLQSVGESLKWEKQKEAEQLGNGLETDSVSTWSPNFWRKDLEEKLMQYMTAQIPPFASSTNTDEAALKQHLSHLEGTFLPSLEHSSDVFREAGLLVTYARCCHASLCSHLATLTDSNSFSFSQSLLIYGWIIKMYKRGSQACERPGHSLSLGAQCLVWILLKTEEKLLAIARKEVRKALKEAFDIGKPPWADAAVIEIITEKTEAARQVSESLGEKVEAECLEECLRFLERTVWHKLTYICSVSTEQNGKVNGFLHRMEDDIMEHFLQTITSKVKGTLKDHFKKCDSGFDHILESLKQNFLTFGKKKTDIYEALVKAVIAIIITEYMQALLTTPRKTSAMQRRRIVNKIEEDHRMMQTIFKECLGPAAGSLKDPIKAILELVQTSDPEGMKIALLPILKEFPDLRKEHLSAVLDIKDSLSREDRAALLKAFHDNCRESETEANLLFADIEVKPRKCGLCGCLCC